MTITAIPAGSKSGIGKILAAIVIIAAAYYLGPLGTSLSNGLGFSLSAGQAWALAAVGINLALTGIQQIMAPDASTDNQQDESYIFQGSGQTILEGDPVPVLYGKLRVPGRPISFEVKNANQTFIDFAEAGTDSIGPNDPTSPGQGGGSSPHDMPTEVLN